MDIINKAEVTSSHIRIKQASYNISEKGFTLIELMVALVLGLLISAAALQIFYTSSVNARRQEAGSQIQDNTIFGLSDLQYRLRRVNYGAHSDGAGKKFFMNHLTPQGGIVLTAPDGVGEKDAAGKSTVSWADSNLYGLKMDNKAIDADLLSKNASTKSGSNLAGIAHSDQLTIQYQAGIENTFDCQGRSIPLNYYVIERYFVRVDTDTNRNGLACASAIYKYDATEAGGAGIDIKNYTPPSATTPINNNLDGDGMIVIPNVDYFRILLGVSSNSNFAIRPEDTKVVYIPIPDTPNTELNNNRIVGIQMGLLTHSDNPTATGKKNSELRFNILDKKNISLNDATQKESTYLRNVYESGILFRNARGGV